ncbi:MAG: nickel-dependent lactate racemase [Acidimicrobiales bacterium]
MTTRLAYGEGSIGLVVPEDRTSIVSPSHPRPVPDEKAAVRAALRHPVRGPCLSELGRPGMSLAIAICDGTRPQPHRLMVSAILEELSTTIASEDVVVIVATGTHRANTADELQTMLGADILDAVRVINHDARDEASLRWVGHLGAGVPVWLSSEWLEADLKVTTGFVEPHFFAGFSGGPKLVAPGLAGLETILVLHDASRIGHPKASWGITKGNPVHDDVRAIAAATGVDFACDVVLDGAKRVVAAFGGELDAMHEAACSLSRAISMQAVERAFEVVVTSNSGFPLDQNLYQAVKGMSAAAQVTLPGGQVICAAECRDGFPDHGSYRQIVRNAWPPEQFLAELVSSRQTEPDQWQVQVQARIQSQVRVAVHTSFLSAEELAEAHFEAAPDLQEAVDEAVARAGPTARLCVLPEGPATIPYLRSRL